MRRCILATPLIAVETSYAQVPSPGKHRRDQLRRARQRRRGPFGIGYLPSACILPGVNIYNIFQAAKTG
jgi:hypothetical protein